MSWPFVAALIALVMLAMALWFKLPRAQLQVVGAALALGLAGYALQARPGLAGSPRAAAEAITGTSSSAIAARQALGGAAPANNWIVIADALARHGQYADAAELLRGAVAKEPGNTDAWLAMANALVAHSENSLTPAALYAYQRAAQAAPDNPGPPFFLGLALAQSGRLAEGRALWAGVLARAPKDAPWRADLTDRLSRLDAFIAARNGADAAP